VTKRKAAPKAPWAKAKSARRVLTPDELWALELREKILDDCHPWQRDAALDPATRISLLVGRGGTKTTTMRVRGLLKSSSITNCDFRYTANSRAQAEELMWNKLKAACEAYGVMDDFYFLDTKLRMTCRRTGGVMQLFGIEDRRDADKLRGFPADEVDLDEVGSMDPRLLDYTIEECIVPRIGERNGTILTGSTPPPRLAGPFYDATRDGAVDEDGVPLHRPYRERDKPEYTKYGAWIRWSSHAWDAEQIVALPDAATKYAAIVANWNHALVTKKSKGWADDHPIWLREYKGRWASDHTSHVFRYQAHVNGKPFNQWDPRNGLDIEGLDLLRASLAALPKDVGAWHFLLIMDSGSRDPFACNVYAFAPADPDRRMIHVFFFERTQMYARTEAELLIGPEAVARLLAGGQLAPYGGLFALIGWPDALVMDADQTHLDELGNVYGIRAKKADRKADYKFGGFELVNGDLVAVCSDGRGRIWIIKGSPLERQMQALQWKPDDYGNLREDKAQPNHSTDTLVYGRIELGNLFESGAVVAEKAANTPAAQRRALLEEISSGRDEDESLLTPVSFDDSDDGW
jgi:hypothetical protein